MIRTLPKKHIIWIGLTVGFSALFILSMYYYLPLNIEQKQPKVAQFDESSENELDELETKKGRATYFNRILKDPKINRIPKGIRREELAFCQIN